MTSLRQQLDDLRLSQSKAQADARRELEVLIDELDRARAVCIADNVLDGAGSAGR